MARFCQPFLHFYRGCVVVNTTNFQQSVTHHTSAATNMFLTPAGLKGSLEERGGEERRIKERRGKEIRDEVKERTGQERRGKKRRGSKGEESENEKIRRRPACLARHIRHHTENPSKKTGKGSNGRREGLMM